MKSIKNQYIDLQEGRTSQANFMRNMRMSLPQYITNVTSFKDTVKILKNKGILSEADIKYKDGKDIYAQFNEIDNLNGQEVLAGTAIEHSCFPDKTNDEILKIVVKNLKKNPFYYTDYKMSGVAGYEPEYIGGKSAEPNARQMKPVEKDNAVDKAMGMKPVKGFEKAKASSNKAKKETNKGEDVEIMSLIAKTVRGLVKMDATGEKVKKIIVKEGTELNEGPLGTQLLRKADAALKAGQTVTVQGTPIMKIVVPAGALFPANGGPSFRLNNLENPLEDILVDGNEIELDLPAPQAPRMDTRTPDQIAADQAAFNDRYGPGGGYDTPAGRRTFDESKMEEGGYRGNLYYDLIDKLKERDIVFNPEMQSLYINDVAKAMTAVGYPDREIYNSINNDEDFIPDLIQATKDNREDYEPDTDADYEEPNDDFDMAEGMDNLNEVLTIVKVENHPLPLLAGKGYLQITLSNGGTAVVSGGELEGMYGGDSDNLDYYIGKKWDQDEDGDTNTERIRNVGVGLQSPMEEMIRKVVREMFDGMEPMDRTGMDA